VDRLTPVADEEAQSEHGCGFGSVG
jgi:hypothetical protein